MFQPHVDSARFCGDVVAVLSLLSPAVAKFVHVENKDYVRKCKSVIYAGYQRAFSLQHVSCLVPRRSLYVMKDLARYQFTHEILPKQDDEESVNTQWAREYPRTRRVSVVCRCQPNEDDAP